MGCPGGVQRESNMLQSLMSITVGLRDYKVIPDLKSGSLECNCARGEIHCPPETTLRELGEAITSLGSFEMPALRRIPLLRVR
jgi:hypothetical protein